MLPFKVDSGNKKLLTMEERAYFFAFFVVITQKKSKHSANSLKTRKLKVVYAVNVW